MWDRCGDARCRRRPVRPRPVHPRGRGERVRTWNWSVRKIGSSPRAQGTHAADLHGRQPLRFIPAGAGGLRKAQPRVIRSSGWIFERAQLRQRALPPGVRARAGHADWTVPDLRGTGCPTSWQPIRLGDAARASARTAGWRYTDGWSRHANPRPQRRKLGGLGTMAITADQLDPDTCDEVDEVVACLETLLHLWGPALRRPAASGHDSRVAPGAGRPAARGARPWACDSGT